MAIAESSTIARSVWSRPSVSDIQPEKTRPAALPSAVIVKIATGATMIAAVHVARGQAAHEIIVAAPVAPPTRLRQIARLCDEAICLATPADFWAVGQFYQDFSPVTDEDVIALLRQAAPRVAEPAGDSGQPEKTSNARASSP